MLKGFRDFIMRGNVVDLAVAVVVGGAFNGVVAALVKDLITPIFGSFGGTPDFSGLFFTVNSSKFLIGDFLNALISFLITAAVVYFLIVIPMNHVSGKNKPAAPLPVTEKNCPYCLSAIPIKAKKCRFCTSNLPK